MLTSFARSVTDTETGRGVRGIRAVDQETGAVSTSNGEGVVKVLNDQPGTQGVTFEIGTGDRRYRLTTISGDLPADSMLEVTVPLEKTTQVSNT